jgi:hypothetical protein
MYSLFLGSIKPSKSKEFSINQNIQEEDWIRIEWILQWCPLINRYIFNQNSLKFRS